MWSEGYPADASMLKSFVRPVNPPSRLLQKKAARRSFESRISAIFLKLLAKLPLTPLRSFHRKQLV